jgi:hypothetical protein
MARSRYGIAPICWNSTIIIITGHGSSGPGSFNLTNAIKSANINRRSGANVAMWGARFVVSDAPQRARRQPSRNLAQALPTTRLQASDLMGQQVNGKEHNAVMN